MRILVLAAFQEELNDIYKIFPDLKQSIIAKRRCMVSKQKDYEIIISLCGVGTIASSSTTTAFCEVLEPDLIIMCGVAGGLDQSLKIGDLVLADKVIDADLYSLPSILVNTPYKSCLIDPHNLSTVNHEYKISPLLLETAGLIEGLKTGTIVTSNVFPAPKSLFKDIQNMGCTAIEMESIGIFKAAQYYDIPVMTIRAISNLLDENGDDLGTLPDALSICSKQLALFLTDFLIHSPKLEILATQKQQKRISEIVSKYDLCLHPEGGWFRRTFKSFDTVKVETGALGRYLGESRSAGTSIIYLLSQDQYSAWHTVQSDETWNFHAGDPLIIRVINPLNGDLEEVVLSQTEGLLQFTVKSGEIFSAETTGRFTLAGCTVTPGFDFKDFKLISMDDFSTKYPQHSNLTRLIRDEIEVIDNKNSGGRPFFKHGNLNNNNSINLQITQTINHFK